ncbi:MAG: BspA family leucine-rich repeat surface protein [Promethearchaeota archaeon]
MQKKNNSLLLASIIVISLGIVVFVFVFSPREPSEVYITHSFRSKWDTTRTSSGSSNTTQVKLPLESSGTYNFTVDWGDGTNDTITSWDQAEATHNYASDGVYTVIINRTIIGWCFNNSGDKLKLLEIKEWSVLRLGNSGGYFYGCTNLRITTHDVLNLTGTTSLARAFSYCRSISKIGGMNEWNTSKVTKMSEMFYRADSFNQYIGDWDVSSVTDMCFMFYRADSFNRYIGDWDVSSVTNMSGMFYFAFTFNQDIGGWNVSNVIDMSAMFAVAETFNQDIGGWNVSNVIDMSAMFASDVFNQDIGGWNVSNVIDMSSMFYDADVFNQDIGGWNVSSVTDMSYMFKLASAFDQDIGSWKVSGVNDMMEMFNGVTISTSNYDSLLINWSSLSLQTEVSFDGGNSQYSAGTAASARASIISSFNWTITDGGQAP